MSAAGESSAGVKHTAFVDRYFRKFYKRDIKGRPGEDQCVLVHSNRVCLVCLARRHPIISNGKTVTNVSFQVTEKTDRLKNVVVGKNKRGAQQLTDLSPLCHVTCDDGSRYTLVSCINGSLVEVNDRLLEDPSLLTAQTCGSGYIAIVLPRLKDFEKHLQRLESGDACTVAASMKADNSARSFVDSTKQGDNCVDNPAVSQGLGDVVVTDMDILLRSDSTKRELNIST